MTDDLFDPDALQGFGSDARRAVVHAELEARELGHDRIGTEHLLLGLLAVDDGGAAEVLNAAGVTIAAARHKVSEAVGGPAATGRHRTSVRLAITPRAARALGRSVRFSHARRAEVVTSEHVLQGVLDVEGTAGQVLRGLGIDVDRLRASLDALDALDATEPRSDHGTPRSARDSMTGTVCPSCAADVADELAVRVVAATEENGRTRDALVYSCGSCGCVLGVSPA